MSTRNPHTMLTDEDIEIVLGRRYQTEGAGRGIHAYFRNAVAEAIDADIMRRLVRTRRNNKRARAFPDVPGELAA